MDITEVFGELTFPVPVSTQQVGLATSLYSWGFPFDTPPAQMLCSINSVLILPQFLQTNSGLNDQFFKDTSASFSTNLLTTNSITCMTNIVV